MKLGWVREKPLEASACWQPMVNPIWKSFVTPFFPYVYVFYIAFLLLLFQLLFLHRFFSFFSFIFFFFFFFSSFSSSSYTSSPLSPSSSCSCCSSYSSLPWSYSPCFIFGVSFSCRNWRMHSIDAQVRLSLLELHPINRQQKRNINIPMYVEKRLFFSPTVSFSFESWT